MASICLHLRAHQPDRLRPFRIIKGTSVDDYFDEGATIIAVADLVERAYRPALALLEDLIEQANGAVRLGLGISGLLLDRFGDRHADIIDAVRRLLATDAVELTNESYYHSPAWLYAEDEFTQQLKQQADRCEVLLGVRPQTVVDSVGGAGLGSRLATVLDPRASAQTFIRALITEPKMPASYGCALELEALAEAGSTGFEFLSDLIAAAQAVKLQFRLPRELAITGNDNLALSLRTAEQRDLALALFELDQYVRSSPDTLESWRRLQAIDHLRDQPGQFQSILEHFSALVRSTDRSVLLTTAGMRRN